MPRFGDYTAASFQRAHVNVCISVSKICIKVHKAQYGMKGACAGHVQRTALVDGARIGAQNAILCWCNTTLGINLRVHGAHNVKYKYPSGARKSNIPYWHKAQIEQKRKRRCCCCCHCCCCCYFAISGTMS